jgi:hypothetical protein
MTDDDIIEAFEHSAALIEYDGWLPSRNAESMALRIISKTYGQGAAKVAHRHAEARRAKGEDE